MAQSTGGGGSTNTRPGKTFRGQRKIVPIKNKQTGKTEFRSIGKGIQWASCQDNFQGTRTPILNNFQSSQGRSGGGAFTWWVSGSTNLLANGAMISAGIAMNLVAIPIYILNSTIWVFVTSSAEAKRILMEINQEKWNTNAELLEELFGANFLSREITTTDFMDFNEPCSENAGVDF